MLGQGLAGLRTAWHPCQAAYLFGFVFPHRGLEKQREERRRIRTAVSGGSLARLPWPSLWLALYLGLKPLGGSVELVRERCLEARGLPLPL